MTRAFLVTALGAAALALSACETTPSAGSAGSQGDLPAPLGAAPGFAPEASLQLCPRMTVSNAPAADAEGSVRGYHPFADIGGVAVLVNPAPKACLSSAFGQRSGRLHKGLDYQSDPAGPVLAAQAGTVVESGYRDDYGQYVLIDHGSGVFTRYAHLATLTGAAREGRVVQLGVMGNTASYRIPVHLHFEVLTGDYATAKKSFGLKPVDPLKSVKARAAS
ncbi:M23 family metallopeptidase [Parvularcula maris]|uniref:M23 family metallopeptidase n=1 Tax=Parvularcula maris TaxID=2965077 RepID=A0A9X2RIB9_9PROT|nr:M23 family metallopeptidase [Parvularcula maris]MCQ8184786.1 M23 family metallopeptidase [Parvularcula maris]